MPQIVLTHEQARTIEEAGAPVEVRDPAGKWLGRLDPKEADVIATLMRERGTQHKLIPAASVEAHLRALEAEWTRTGGFDRKYMRDLLEKYRAEDS